jgi:hypothetical protein
LVVSVILMYDICLLALTFFNRCLNGGGPGGPIPYRIYIDSGVVFLCTVALGPICPLLAPVSALYFLFCVPLLRRNCIFIYRPTFDAGGALWPFLADICLTSMIFAQVFLTVIMALKQAVGYVMLICMFFILFHRLTSVTILSIVPPYYQPCRLYSSLPTVELVVNGF